MYHVWSYSLQGDLTDVAFNEGIHGKGGMVRGFCMGEHGTTKLRVSSIAGLVFGSFDQNVPNRQYGGGDDAK
jgi:anthranilate 1,2-dioxygenase large subunit